MAKRKADLNEALDVIDMSEWLSYEGIEYKMVRGTRGMQCNVKTCPSCGSDSYKVYINADSGLGNCFSGDCEKRTFNKFSFIREYLSNFQDKVDMGGYIAKYAREMGWRPKVNVSTDVEMKSETLRLPEYVSIPINGRNLSYLAKRRVTIDVAKYFHLGYIPSGHFGKRVLIPIHDLDGSLVTFQARDITGTAEKKYLFPRGLAATGKILYNGHNAWHKKNLLVVEGAFDVIGAKIAMDEDPNLRKVGIVGTFGMSLSGNASGGDDDQLSRFIELKEKGLENVTIMWDGEARAMKKAAEAGAVLKSIGLNVKVSTLPKDKDPSSVAPEVLRCCYRDAKPLDEKTMILLRMLSPT